MKCRPLILFLIFLTFSVGSQTLSNPNIDSVEIKDYFILIIPPDSSDTIGTVVSAQIPYTFDNGDKTERVAYVILEKNRNTCLKVHKSYLYSVDVYTLYLPIKFFSHKIFNSMYKHFTSFSRSSLYDICAGKGHEYKRTQPNCEIGVYELELETLGLKKLNSSEIPVNCIELNEEANVVNRQTL